MTASEQPKNRKSHSIPSSWFLRGFDIDHREDINQRHNQGSKISLFQKNTFSAHYGLICAKNLF